MASHLSLKEVRRWLAMFKWIYTNHMLYNSPVKERTFLKGFCLTQISKKKTKPKHPNKTIFCTDSLKIVPVWLFLYVLPKHLSNTIFSTGQLANEINFVQFVIGTERSTEHSVPNTGIRCHLKLLWVFQVSALHWQLWHRTYKQLMPFSGLTAEISRSFEMATRLQYLNWIQLPTSNATNSAQLYTDVSGL